jgi:uncharacterized protein YecE (DUF72 family)
VTSEFIDSLLPLQKTGKLGPALFQLPPNLKCDLMLLTDFLAGLPCHVRSAFEFRHPSWFQDGVFAALRKANVALCQAESEKLETPDVQTADFSCLRLRKENYSTKVRKAIRMSGGLPWLTVCVETSYRGCPRLRLEGEYKRCGELFQPNDVFPNSATRRS